ncbi:uncharacterized protein [Palaemon carinicauda]|uniref:uncharacterized protein n=1 Tax=Palaemon carinicauda TaxID=392227 RepID=UPI0035B69FDE
MFGRQMIAFSPRRKRLGASKFFSKISSSLSDIPGDVFRSTLEAEEEVKAGDKKDDFYEVRANCLLEDFGKIIEEDEEVGNGKEIEEIEKGESIQTETIGNDKPRPFKEANDKADWNKDKSLENPSNNRMVKENHSHTASITQEKMVSPVRDRSRVGLRSSLPFSTMGLASAASSSGVSSGSSDTQSQGSGGDSKSDSPTPEGSRKNIEGSSSSSSSSSGVGSGVSLRCAKGHELPVTTGARESAALRQEVETLRAEITKARQTILHMQEREKKLKDRLGDRASRGLERGTGRVENLSLGERRPSALVRRYGNLYAQARVDTLDSLDSLPDLKNAEELKSKLLFSVVVLAFRSAASSAAALKEEVRRALQMPPPPCHGDGHDHQAAYDTQSHALELAISSYVTTTIDKHDLTKNVDEVCQQIWATLYDYPTLKSCEGLLQYIKDCVRLAWGLSNQTPPYVIDYETRTFKKECHVRFHTADPDNDVIKTYLWPVLLEGPGGACVQKGVVVT